MLDRIDERTEFWDDHHVIGCQGPTEIDIKTIRKYSVNSSILEIGPGQGRQFKYSHPYCKDYSIADISNKVLSNSIYEKVNKYLIKSYKENLNKKFNFIHFWYLIHHVLLEEDEMFFDFIIRHSIKNTVVAFNFAEFSRRKANKNNGMETTYRSKSYIIDLLCKKRLNPIYLKQFAINSITIVCIYE